MWLIISHIWEDRTIKVYFIFEKIRYFSDSMENCDKATFIFISVTLCKTLFSYTPGITIPAIQEKKDKLKEAVTCPRPKRWYYDSQKCSIEAQDRNKINDKWFLKATFYVYYYTCTHMHKGEKQRWGGVFLLSVSNDKRTVCFNKMLHKSLQEWC